MKASVLLESRLMSCYINIKERTTSRIYAVEAIMRGLAKKLLLTR